MRAVEVMILLHFALVIQTCQHYSGQYRKKVILIWDVMRGLPPLSQWTRLCELDIPSAVEKHLQNPEEHTRQVPSAILNLS
ncbi:glutathione S-transferase C-terminal domain-containing protein-like isoform X5 [Xyrauchen texanus]|uniref:glutathione S-transferase C-terminal domain-containing protein-like isoform X5 n=1 Tax=Xyrauchen texanus TaxID=154827 RepID=UPI0022427C42|nr:glutathione S-transferase C-terminal domain-containing protein-like isoform X5 [Xyrauchen texanus]